MVVGGSALPPVLLSLEESCIACLRQEGNSVNEFISEMQRLLSQLVDVGAVTIDLIISVLSNAIYVCGVKHDVADRVCDDL